MNLQAENVQGLFGSRNRRLSEPDNAEAPSLYKK